MRYGIVVTGELLELKYYYNMRCITQRDALEGIMTVILLCTCGLFERKKEEHMHKIWLTGIEREREKEGA